MKKELSKAELKKLLKKHGDHLYPCPKAREDGGGGEFRAREKCTCGWYTVLIEVFGYKPYSSKHPDTSIVDEVAREKE